MVWLCNKLVVEVIYGSSNEVELVVIEGTWYKKLFMAIDDMITQRIKFFAIMHIATKISLLLYCNEVNLNSSLQINCTTCPITFNN
jgi:hypothetical protein